MPVSLWWDELLRVAATLSLSMAASQNPGERVLHTTGGGDGLTRLHQPCLWREAEHHGQDRPDDHEDSLWLAFQEGVSSWKPYPGIFGVKRSSGKEDVDQQASWDQEGSQTSPL